MIYDEVALGLRARGMKESDMKDTSRECAQNMRTLCVSKLANCSFKLWSKKGSL